MGSGASQYPESPTGSSKGPAPKCDQCVNLKKSARGWCPKCRIYLCYGCACTHNSKHKLDMGPDMPQIRPDPDSLTDTVPVKILTPYAGFEDKDMRNEDTPLEERYIRGCICIDKYVITIRLKNLTLYDEDFKCIGDIDYKIFNPLSICCRNTDVVVSFRKPNQSDATNQKKLSGFKDIQLYQLVMPGCASDAKLVKQKNFSTEGECFTTSVCPLYEKELVIAAGMKLDSHPERDDIEYQVQIINAKGKVLQTLFMDPRAEPSFNNPFFLCATFKNEEIIVSEPKERQVRGIDMKTGKTLFQFEGGSPQGLTCDEEDNIYVFNEDQVFWIPASRHKIHYMQQTYNKKKKKKETRMAVSICYNNPSKILYIASIDKECIDAYTVT